MARTSAAISPGNYNVKYDQIWRKPRSITFYQPEKPKRQPEREPPAPLDHEKLYKAVDSLKGKKAPDFDKMTMRKLMINYSSYKEEGSEQEEQRKLDEYFKLHCRPPSSLKRSKPA